MNKDLVQIKASIIRNNRAKQSFYNFVVDFWDIIISEDFVDNFHIGYLCQELDKVGRLIIARKPKKYDLLINVPPGTSKSTIVTIMFPAWLWALDPTIRTISNSYSSDISIEHAVKTRDIVTSDRFKQAFPDTIIRRDKSGKGSYDTTANGARYTTSTGGSITGKHAHLIINDDPQNPKQASSEAHRKQSVDHTKTLASRKVNKEVSVIITVMQRLNMEDVSGYLIENKTDIKHIKLPAELTENTMPKPIDDVFNGKTILEWYKEQGGLLDDKRLKTKAIEEARVDLGSRGYNGQFLQNPTAEGGDIIKKEWLQIISKSEFDKITYSKAYNIEFFLDTAYTDKTENDPSGIIACCKIGNNLYITKAIKVRKEFPELLRFIPEWVKSNGYDSRSSVRIEPKANGLSVIQTLQRSTNLNVTKIPAPRDDKKARLNAVSAKIESGRVIIVEGSWNDEFIHEVTSFPNASHDEYVDVMVYAINHFLSNETSNSIVSNILW